MPGFNSAGNGDLTSGLFLTETDILDDLVGDSLFLWGYNFYGSLGDNTIVDKSFPVQTIAGGTNWKQVSITCFSFHPSAIKTDGTLWVWGLNNFGQLGNNTADFKSSPGREWRKRLDPHGAGHDRWHQ